MFAPLLRHLRQALHRVLSGSLDRLDVHKILTMVSSQVNEAKRSQNPRPSDSETV